MTDDLDEIFGIPMPEKKSEDHAGSEEAAFSDTINEANGISFEDQASKVDAVLSNTGRSANKISRKNNNGQTKLQNSQDGSNADEAVPHRDAREEKHDAVGHNQTVNKIVNDEEMASSQPTKINLDNKKVVSKIFSEFNVHCEDHDLISFYNLKQDALTTWLLPGGTMDFPALMDELRMARPDLSSVVFGDMQSMFVALNRIQKWKDRITSMHVDINQQYYAWKRAIELFRGSLARCRYEKPSERQEGVVMEHMGDLIVYMSKLEALHFSVSAVAENLDTSFDCISRQITTSVSTIGKDVDFVEKKTNNAISNNEELSDYDSISSQPTIINKNKTANSNKNNSKSSKAGTVDWT